MSTINSGLGWSCDSDYYVDTANTILYVNTSIPATSYKNNNGAAICAALKLSADNNYRMFILSSISDYAKNHEIYDGTPSSAETIYTVTIDSNIWYISEVGHDYNTYDTNIFVCGGEADAVSCNISDFRNGRNDARKNIIESILSSANVQFIKHIPTTDYVKEFVEGVEAKTVEKVNALFDITAPSFDLSQSYAVDNFVIYNDILYKCNTAHSGVWDSTHFTQTNVVSEIENGSGGDTGG